MKTVNVAELRAHLGAYLADVGQGEEVQICKRNKGIARILKMSDAPVHNRTRLGCARGSVQILGDIVSPASSEEDWEMLR